MSEQPNGNTLELKRIVRMLETTIEMAQDASMTGSLAEKSVAAVRTYNKTVNHLLSTGEISSALFGPLPDDATLTDVAMSSAQLAEYLRAGLPEEGERAPRAGAVMERSFSVGVLNLGGDKDELSQMIRDHLAEFLGQAKQDDAQPEAESTSAGAATAAGAAPPNHGPAAGTRRSALPPQARVEELQPEGQAAEARRH
jgi:hypothetical protein